LGGGLNATPLGNYVNNIMKKQIVAFIFILFLESAVCQGVLKVTTDKTNYAYGDSIVVRITVTNNTDTSFTLTGSSTCFMRIKFNDLRLSPMCTADQHQFYFSSGMSRTWIWYLYPNDLGIPDKEGVQKIVGSCGKLNDSVYISAPKYRGGIIAVGIKDSIPDSVYQSLRDSLNATLMYRSLGPLVFEYWRVVNHSIDSLVEKYSQDYRLDWIIVKRTLEFNKHIVTNIKLQPVIPSNISLSQNYPNPFNPVTKIKYSLPKSVQVIVKVYDILGNEIFTLIDKYVTAGEYEIEFNASKLPSGVYFYNMTAGTTSITRKLLLMK
jgi:hypothetical protein